MSCNAGTTLLVQTACLLDNISDTQAASVYKHYNLMISPYLLLVTGNLWSNPSRAKCTALVGISYRLNSIYQENAFYVVFKISPTFSGLNKIATRQLQTTISSTTHAVSVISSHCPSDICMRREWIFVKIISLYLPNNSALRGLSKSKWNAWFRQAFLVYQINQAIASDTPSAWVSFQLIGVTLGVSGISISTLPLESCRDFDMMGHPVGNSLVFH